MNMILVTAAAGCRVPLADNPHQYITDTPQEVDGDNVYYRRLLAEGDLLVEGDLIRVAHTAPALADTAGGQPENEPAHLGESQNAKKGK